MSEGATGTGIPVSSGENLIIAAFQSLFPAFAAVDPVVIQNALTFWTNWFNVGAWGENFGDAVNYATAHSLALAQIEGGAPNGGMQAASGNVASANGAGVTIGFSPPTFEAKGPSESYWMKTSYGQFFLLLRHNCIRLGMLSSGGSSSAARISGSGPWLE